MGRRSKEVVEAAGRVSKTFGTGGELAVSLYDAFLGFNTEEEPVYFIIDDIRTPLFFKSFRRKGNNKAVVVFDDFESEYRASELVGATFFVKSFTEDQKDNDELFLEDLAGYRLLLQGESLQGEIKGYIDSEYNPLFEVLIAGRDVLIPAADDFIVSVDERRREITMSLPEGLLDINLPE